MRHFLSPGEQALLDAVSDGEREVIRDLFDLLDAHLVEDPLFTRESKPRADVWWKEKDAA